MHDGAMYTLKRSNKWPPTIFAVYLKKVNCIEKKEHFISFGSTIHLNIMVQFSFDNAAGAARVKLINRSTQKSYFVGIMKDIVLIL